MALEKFRAPALPIPAAEYDQRTMTDIIRALRLYFNQLDSLTPNQAQSYRADNFYGGEFDGTTINVDTVNASTLTATFSNVAFMMSEFIRSKGFLGGNYVGGSYMGDNFYGGFFHGNGKFLNFPYNQFLSNVDQTFTLGTAKSVELEVTNFTDGIYIAGANDDEITFSEPGVYSITYSLSYKNSNNEGQFIDIWIEYNGTNYPDSNSRFFIPARKNNNDPSYLIAVTTIYGVAQAANDYVRIMWHASSTDVIMEHLPAVTAVPNVTPDIPETPSAIVQAAFVSAEFPPEEQIAPVSVTGLGQIGSVIVDTTNTI